MLENHFTESSERRIEMRVIFQCLVMCGCGVPVHLEMHNIIELAKLANYFQIAYLVGFLLHRVVEALG